MNQIKCPNCGQGFVIDEAGYADIVNQVRTVEFQAELAERLALAAQDQANAVELAKEKAQSAAREEAAALQKQIAELRAEIAAASTVKATEAELLRAQLRGEAREAMAAVEQERDALKHQLEAVTTERKLAELSLKEQHTKEVALWEERLQEAKDFKARLSTKMLGETLEQHCLIAFEQLRATAFQSARFGKDNDAATGSKGDFIFRDFGPDGTEFISIMFEMKNQADTTATKKCNVDFLRELDKDRNEKNCDYAVLVSTLEADDNVYNGGIVDVSHLYPRMYVVRPQFFIPIITLLRNAARVTVDVRAELERAKAENLDITNFQQALSEFQENFSLSVGNAAKQYDKAIDSIDAAIAKLEGVKEALRLWLKHMNTAAGKSDKLSVKALTSGNTTMQRRFAELEDSAGGGE